MNQTIYESLPLRFRNAESNLSPINCADFCSGSRLSSKHPPSNLFIDDEYYQIPNCTLLKANQLPQSSSQNQSSCAQKVRMILFEPNYTPIPTVDDANALNQSINSKLWFLRNESTGVLAILPSSQQGPRNTLRTCSRRNITLLSVTLALPIFGVSSSAQAKEQQTLLASKSKKGNDEKLEANQIDKPSEPVATPNEVNPTIPDSAWNAMLQQDVELVMNDGSSKIGRLGGHEKDKVILIERGSGVVLTIPKYDVVQLRDQGNVNQAQPVPTADLKPRHSGLGLLISGAIITGLGGPLLITGAVFLGISDITLGIPLLTSGFVHLSMGIPMVTVGAVRHHRYKQWKRAQAQQAWRFTPVVGRTPGGGWTGGLQFRF